MPPLRQKMIMLAGMKPENNSEHCHDTALALPKHNNVGVKSVAKGL